MRESLHGEPGTAKIVGRSPAIRHVHQLISKVAGSHNTVLIQGQSGVGKELVAREIHDQSQRQAQPFVVVDCGMLNENLLQNELFGHQKGAFTGATALKHGLFEVADKGTIFLDEIGEISPTIQSKLLRVLETNTFRRLGSTRDTKVDIRLVAATNRDLFELSKQGIFREDLYYRLNVFTIHVPPLRDREEDIALLARHFLHRAGHTGKEPKDLAPSTLEILGKYEWPGNIRELQNVIESAVIMAEGPTVEAGDLPLSIQEESAPVELDLAKESLSLKELEKHYITLLLHRLGGHRANVAKVLQISERNLYRKLKEYDLTGISLRPKK